LSNTLWCNRLSSYNNLPPIEELYFINQNHCYYVQDVFLFTLSFLLLFSCKGDEECSTPEAETNFYALSVGNTWTYEYFGRIGLTDEFESFDVFDEVEITETTEINGEEYFVFQTTTIGNNGSPRYVPENGVAVLHYRDSLGYLINEASIKFFQIQITMRNTLSSNNPVLIFLDNY